MTTGAYPSRHSTRTDGERGDGRARVRRLLHRVVPADHGPGLRHDRQPRRGTGVRPGGVRPRLGAPAQAGTGRASRGLGAHHGVPARGQPLAAYDAWPAPGRPGGGRPDAGRGPEREPRRPGRRPQAAARAPAAGPRAAPHRRPARARRRPRGRRPRRNDQGSAEPGSGGAGRPARRRHRLPGGSEPCLTRSRTCRTSTPKDWT